MKLGTKIRILTLLVGGAAFFAACSSKTMSGTDSSTHWLDTCTTSADCGGLSCECGVCTKPCTGSADCHRLAADAVCNKARGCPGEPTVCAKPEGTSTPSMGGTCPDGVAGNDPCDGRIAQCWTTCTQGFRGQFVCSESKWLAGHGLFPCDDGGVPRMDAGMTPGAGGGASTGGATGSGGRVGAAGSGGRVGAAASGGRVGAAGSGGSAGASPGRADAGGVVSTACSRSEDCALVPTVCCPLCRPAMLSERIAITASSVSAYLDSRCATAGACPPCVPSDGTIQAVCNNGKCEAIDVGPYAACTKAEDCKIIPKDCCACGTVRTPGWVAVSDPGGYTTPKCAAVDCIACPGGVNHLTGDYAQCTAGVCELISGV